MLRLQYFLGCSLFAAFATTAWPTHAATQASGDASGVRVSLQASTGTVNTGPLPAGVSGVAPLDYGIAAIAQAANLDVASLARLATGPLRAALRSTLADELSEASAAAQSVDLEIGGPGGIVLDVAGAAASAFVHCRRGAPRRALDSALAGATIRVLGTDIAIDANARPNTVVLLPLAGARLVLNEQSGTGGTASVNALRLTLTDVVLENSPPIVVNGEIVLARATVALAACSSFIDSDSDGVNDDVDTCPALGGASQLDTDGDGSGDACDIDDDGDLVLDAADSCPLEPNPAQGLCTGTVFAHGFED